MRMANSGNLRNMIKANSYRPGSAAASAAGSGRISAASATGSGRIGSGRIGSGRLMRKNTKMIKGVKHVVKGQHPVPFQYDILIHHVDKLTAPGPVCVVCERSKETDATRSVNVDTAVNRASFNQTISKLVKLFKEKKEDTAFLDKIYKLAVRTGGPDGPTIGKIHINLADYASATGSSRKVSVGLSNGSVMVVTFTTSVAPTGSGDPTTPTSSSAAQFNDGSSEDNFDDLGISDEAEDDDNDNERSRTNRTPIFGPRRVSEGNLTANCKLDEMDSNTRSAALLQKKIAGQQRRIKDLEAQNAVLMEELSAADNSTSGAGSSKKWLGRKGAAAPAGGGHNALQSVAGEVQHLRGEVDRLEDLVAREPDFEVLVVELKEVKMTLAMANLEKEQFKLELMNLRKTAGGKKGKKKK